MGLESRVEVTFGGRTSSGKARLESDTLEFRSDAFNLSVPFKAIRKAVAREGTLTLAASSGTLSLELGPAAAKWAAKILHPPSRLDKIGVKPDWKVSVVGRVDQDFLAELEGAVEQLSRSRVLANSDAIFVAATRETDLRRLPRLKSMLRPAGALWVIRPKGRPEISESAVRAAGKAAGLVDVKVVGFSATHTAEKFVIPLRDR